MCRISIISASLLATRTILAIALCTVLVACSNEPDDAKDAPDPSTTAGLSLENGTLTPGLALTPRSGVVIDMQTARRYEAEGDLDAAAAAFVAIAATENPDRIEAALAAGRLLSEQGDHEGARTILTAIVETQAGTPQGTAATYLLGRAFARLDMHQDALQQFDSYVTAGGPATAHAHLERSFALIEMERGFEAATAAQAGLDLGVPGSLARTFILAAAQSYERAGAFDEAIAYYNRLIDEGNLSGDVALALQRIAALKQLQGDPTFAAERDRLLTEFPASFQALVALDEAERAGEAVAPTVHGLILYRHNEYTLAEPHFRTQIENAPAGPESAAAYYYLAAILESRGDLAAALKNYAAVEAYGPSSFIADDALWWRARIHEQEDESASAAPLYTRLVHDYPTSPFADDAVLRQGMLSYQAGAYLEAAAVWESDLVLTTDPLQRQRLLLWQGKALVQAGQTDAATSVLNALVLEAEDDYFGIRARGVSTGQHAHPQSTQEASVDLSPSWDWDAAEQWAAAYTGLPAASRVWETDPRWLRAKELWRVGRGDFGDLEVFDIISAYTGDAAALYGLSRELLTQGRIGMSARAGQRLLRTLAADPSDGLPRALMSLSYPAAFGPLVQRYADAEGLSPLLLLAFVRQESFFDPRAVSPAGALGLTQVLPETAQATAAELGVAATVPREQLLHADLNLRLGARFMANQLARFGGDILVALAAYNAGGNAAQRWDEIAGDDADLFLETVEFAETRLYLEIVAENYAIYRFIYGGESEPNLPK